MNIKSFMDIAKCLPPSQAILMRGGTGIGKSYLAKEIANYHNLPLIDVRGSTMSEGDVGGYPDIEAMKENGVMTFVMPSWFVRAVNEPVVILLDEFNRSLKGVQQSFFQLVLDRELGNDKNGIPYKLNPETRVIAAINHGSEYDVSDMDPALLRRFWVVDIDNTVNEWITWGQKNNIHEIILDFMRQHHEHFQTDLSKIEPGTVTPNPASWHKFDSALKFMNINLDDHAGKNRKSNKIYNLATGFIGVEASITFTDYVKNYNKAIGPDDILNDWYNIKEKVESLTSDKINSLIDKIAYHCKDNEWSVTQAENVSNFAKMITQEMAIHFWGEITKTKKLDNIRKIHKYLASYIVEVVNSSKSL